MHAKKQWIALVLSLLCVLTLCAHLPAAHAAGYGTAIINGGSADRVHLRKSASASAASLGLYFTGTEVLCESDPDKQWVKVTIGSQTGYMKSEFLYRGNNPASVPSKQPTGTVKSTGAWVNLRQSPSLNASAAGKLYNGDTVTVLGETVTEWYYVMIGSQYGYVLADYLSVGDAAPPSAYGTAKVNGGSADRVHLRKSASANAASLGLYFTGTEVLCESDPAKEWVRITIGSQTGYMKSEFLYRGNNPASVPAKQPAGTVKSAGAWVNLRESPSLNAAAAGKLYNGDIITVLGETADHWYYIKTGGQYGYVLSDYVLLGAAASSENPSSPSSSSAALSAYKAVLKDSAAFISAYENKTMRISQWLASFTDISMQVTQFAVVDLDNDSMPEVILRETVNGNDYGFEVLHYQDGKVYGHDFVYRALMELKMDGTFSFSSGAMDSGFGTVTFNQSIYTVDERTYSQSYTSGGSLGVSYYVDHKPATLVAFQAALDKQDKKLDVAWYAFTNANIEAVLAKF